MKRLIYISAIVLMALSCKKKYDTPPITTPKPGSTITLEDLIGMYNGKPVKFDDSLSVFATVTMDESDGNLYRNVYIQDGDFAINMRLLSAGGLYVGDRIRIDLNNTRLSTYNGVLQLDSVHVDKNIVKQAVDKDIEPLVLTIEELNTNLQSRLVKLENVQFTVPEFGMTYADADNNESRDIVIEDCDGNLSIFRNSGYASFANEKIAEGNGSITAIVGVFNDQVQLLVRSFNEIKLDGERCDGQLFVKNFDDYQISTGGWHVEQVVGTDAWETNDQGADSPYCQISNYNGSTNNPCESWLISGAYDLSTISNPKLKFRNACNYQGDILQTLVSTDYSGTGDPTSATWTPLSAVYSTGGWDWKDSGLIDLAPHSGSNVHIAFKYIGSASNGRTWEIDDITIIGSL